MVWSGPRAGNKIRINDEEITRGENGNKEINTRLEGNSLAAHTREKKICSVFRMLLAQMLKVHIFFSFHFATANYFYFYIIYYIHIIYTLFIYNINNL